MPDPKAVARIPLPPIRGKQAMPIRSGSLFMTADICVAEIGDRFALNKSHVGAVCFVDVILFARTGNIMSAADNALHPTKSRVACRADLLAPISLRGHFDESVTAFVEPKSSVPCTRPHNLALVWKINKVIFYCASHRTKVWIARTHNPNSFYQAHGCIHGKTEIGRGCSSYLFKFPDQI